MREFLTKRYHNSSRHYLKQFAARAAESLPGGSIMLDAGAGTCIYKPLFTHVKYESADFCQIENFEYGEITYVCDLTSIPVEDQRYDLVLCTQVLFMVPEPGAVLAELLRILKPGKELWVSGPLFYEEFPPYDYYRHTQFGMRHLLEKAGFRVKQIEWLEGYYGTLAYQFKTAAATIPVAPKDYGSGATGCLGALSGILLKPFYYFLALYYSRLDMRYKYVNSGMCKNYAVVAVKPA
jgi:SAM-dependent methyltransferase